MSSITYVAFYYLEQILKINHRKHVSQIINNLGLAINLNKKLIGIYNYKNF